MPSDYRRGFEDGQASARAMADALKGPDRTLYEFVGGPKHGERIETGGELVIRVPVIPPVNFYQSFAEYPTYDPIRLGEYKREQIMSPRGKGSRIVYVWQGER